MVLENRAPEPRKPVVPPETKPIGDVRPLVVIDPGHGGIDNGTRAASGEMEKTIVLEFSLMLRDKIEKTGKYRVVMTRTDDSFVALDERVQLARARQASLFLSIHADALARGDGDAKGATVYTLSERPSDARAARLAEAENRADAIAGLDLSSEPKDVAGILIDLARRETKTFSQQFAQAVVGELKKAARVHQNPLRSASFVVLRAAGRAIGADRARLCLQQGGPEIDDLRGVARPDRGFDRSGSRCFLQHARGRCRPELRKCGCSASVPP